MDQILIRRIIHCLPSAAAIGLTLGMLLVMPDVLYAQPAGLRRLLISPDSVSVRLPGGLIAPGSVRVQAMGEEAALVASDRYFLLGDRLFLRPPRPAGPLLVSYRTIALPLDTPRSRLDSTGLIRQAEDPLIGLPLRTGPGSASPVDFRRMAYTGSFARGLSFGNNQDLVLNSSFNLQLAGELGDGLMINAAISDENIPIQAEGNTQQLREFDKVFVQLSKGATSLTAGDYELLSPDSYFLRYLKKLQGLTVENTSRLGEGRLHQKGAVAISRGKFSRYVLRQSEGNQGPYRLEGSQGEAFIIVLAGTERIWLDGRLLVRGIENDYTIDYNRGELSFTNRILITRESRIIIEFEYADQNYLRTLSAASLEYRHEKLNLYAHYFGQQDSKNATGNLSLNDEQIEALRRAGDDPALAVLPSINRLEAFTPTRAMYRLTDTLLACGTLDSILVFSNDPDVALYTASFAFVGAGNGHYERDPLALANEPVYRFVAPDPETCRPSGSYAPRLQLTPPQQQRLLVAGAAATLDPQTTAGIELAFSRLDLNRFSPLDGADDQGLAFHARFERVTPLSAQPSGWRLRSSLTYEHAQRHFAALNPYRPQEFLRDWSIAGFSGTGVPEKADEHLIGARLELAQANAGQIAYAWGAFLRDTLYEGIKHELAFRLPAKQLLLTGGGSLLNAQTPTEKRRFVRPTLSLSNTFTKLGDWTAALEYTGETNARRDLQADSLTSVSFQFHRLQALIRSPESTVWNTSLAWTEREDLLPLANAFAPAVRIRQIDLEGDWNAARTLRMEGTFTYRKLANRQAAGQDPAATASGATFLGRLTLDSQPLKGAIRTNTTYELGTGQERRVAFTFIKVARGQGDYIWLDSLFNNDGVIQAQEMELAPFADLADFIRVNSFEDAFIRTDYLTFNQSLQLNPKAVWFGATSGWKATLARFATQTSIRINRKTQAGTDKGRYNPFLLDVADSTLVSVTAGIQHILFFNRASRKFELQFSQTDNRSKILQTGGFETRRLEEYRLRGRLNFNDQWSGRVVLTTGIRFSDSEFFASKDYRISFRQIEPELNWLPGKQFRLIGKYRFQYDQNTLPDDRNPARAITHELRLEATLTQNAATSFRSRFSWVQVDLTGSANAPVGFAILNGLQNGRNLLWTLNLEKQLAQNLRLQLTYEGRQTGNNRIVHVGRAQVAALF